MSPRHDEPYCPSNGSEGEGFMAGWCWQCEREQWMRVYLEGEEEPDDDMRKCPILTAAQTEGFAKEWVWKDGKPVCTAYWPAGEPLPEDRDDQTLDMFELGEVLE